MCIFSSVNGSSVFQQATAVWGIKENNSTPSSVITSKVLWPGRTPSVSVKCFLNKFGSWTVMLSFKAATGTHDSRTLAKLWKYNLRSRRWPGPKMTLNYASNLTAVKRHSISTYLGLIQTLHPSSQTWHWLRSRCHDLEMDKKVDGLPSNWLVSSNQILLIHNPLHLRYMRLNPGNHLDKIPLPM